jgi:hypothetical protein
MRTNEGKDVVLKKLGPYEFHSDTKGYIWITYNKKQIASGDYDSGSRSFWFNVPWHTRGQKSYDEAIDALKDFKDHKQTQTTESKEDDTMPDDIKDLTEDEIKDLEENGELDSGQDFAGHRQIISHALSGEPAQIAPIFNTLVRDKISDRMETTRAEVGANMFGGDEN